MPRSKTDAPADAQSKASLARTQLNHIIGHCGILGQDAIDAGAEELAALFETIAESAASLIQPLGSRFSGSRGETLDHEIYGILYAFVALVQDVKGKASSKGLKHLATEADRLLDLGNAVLELMAAQEASVPIEGEAAGAQDASEALADAELAAALPAARPGRILVVDDNLFNRELLSRQLERQGHEVRATGDGLSALELLRSETFDVAIIDVMLPGMNGYQLLERIRAEDGIKGVHAIVISALEDTRIIARCIQLGAEDYMPREFEPVILRARIESCLEKKRMKEEQELYVAAIEEAQEKLNAELRGGAAYVRSLLPGRIAFPELSIDWEFVPSASLGGDVFGYHIIAGDGKGVGKLALYLIDVSGHGIEAALFSVTLMNMLKTQVLPGADFTDPASVLDRLNASFKMEDQNNLYFTAWYGVWDHASRELTYASAGSPPALLVLPEGGFEELSTAGGIVGMDGESTFDSSKAFVPRGSKLYVFSDGIYEFRSKEGSIFGFDRFALALASLASDSSLESSTLERVLGWAKLESGSNRFADDVSLLELRLD
jgi:phosphoserine phosphatase RsbU/P